MQEFDPPAGFLASGVEARINKISRKDLGLILSLEDAEAVALFTRNKFSSAPILINRERLKKRTKIRAVLANSGNANAATGEKGIKLAKEISLELSKRLKIREDQILLASTGVIGKQLSKGKFYKAFPSLIRNLRGDKKGFIDFASSILTTDTRLKLAFEEIRYGKRKVKILGIAKGAGMIEPKMATMLCFILTDAFIARARMRLLLNKAVERSFNRISVDGDMSTNDSVFLLASGRSGVKILPATEDERRFSQALERVCFELARMIVKDGEGATRIFKVLVRNAKTKKQAELISRKIANSLLVKTAISAGDPNWGRIIASIGAVSSKFSTDKLKLWLRAGKKKLLVFENGKRAETYSEKIAGRIFGSSEFEIIVELNEGNADYFVFGCDLTQEYVRINAEYRT